ncbi:ImmA/IrrE family metallo-endopeptidase [Microbacterium sp. VKM Ac-2870]|nr:ImmA/IrrE family metallo-endopeptidase [Microbacterium sp. VKM Ac-2870]
MIFNPDRSNGRVRSDLTHEIAHFEAEHEPSPAWTNGGDSGVGCGGTSKSQEREAAELAGALLVPAAKAKVAAIRDIAPHVVATRCQVSIEMAAWRMRISGGYAIRRRSRLKWQPIS